MVGNGTTGLFDRDEPRYAQTSRQMLASGDWVVPHFLDKIRTAKPVLIYWCQASAMAVIGDNRFAARLPSSLAMAATVAMLAVAVSRVAGRRRGLWCAFILGSCGMAIVSAKMCLTDGVLLLLITTSQLCLYRLWRRGPDGATVLLLGLSAGLAGLTKGPVALGINGTTIVVLWLLSRSVSDKKWQSPWRAEHFPLVVGIAGAVLIATVFPWLYAIQVRAPQFLSTAIGHDVIDRIQRGQEGHAQPPGFYSLIVWATFFPWSLLIPAALVWGWKRRHIPATRFALAALIGPWVMFELIATKLPHYVLPTYPALAYLVADLLVLASRGQVKDLATRGFRGVAWVWGIGVSLIGIAAPVALLVSGQTNLWLVFGTSWIAVSAVLVGISTAMRFRANRPLAAARAMGGGTLLVIAIAYVMVLPNIPTFRLTHDIAQIMIDNGGRGADGYMIDFKEPSLAFEQGGGLREQSDNNYLNITPTSACPEWIIATRPVWDATRSEVKSQWSEVGSVSGVAYSDGWKRHEVLVLRKVQGQVGQ